MHLFINNINIIPPHKILTNTFETKEQQVAIVDIKRSVDLNKMPAGIINKNLINFKGFNNKYSYLFLNFKDVYNSKTQVLPKKFYSGFVEKDIYLSNASASAPLSQANFWKLFSPKVFNEFLDEDIELSKILSKSPLIKFYFNNDLSFSIQNVRSIIRDGVQSERLQAIFDFTKAFEEKYNLDILKEPKYYRFIGKNEAAEILKGNEVRKQNQSYPKAFDITINPELNLNSYRVTFKTNNEFTNVDEFHCKDNVITEHDKNDYRYYLNRAYSLNDVEKLEMGTPHGLLELDLNHNYTEPEINAIDTLMFYE